MISKIKQALFLVTLVLFSFSSCRFFKKKADPSSAISKADSLRKDSVAVVIPFDTAITATARLIAGLNSAGDLIPADWDTAYIRAFAFNSSSKVDGIMKSRLIPMTQWNREIMKRNTIADTSFVFYPFSGGDFIHLHAMYPNATDYLMVAREDVGDLPNLYSKDFNYVKKYINGVDTMLRDIYNKSYFITKNMNDDTRHNTIINGMLPLIVWASSITGHQIISLNYYQMDSGGHLVELEGTHNEGKPDAVTLELLETKTNTKKRLTYLSCDISDEGFQNHPQFYKYIQHTVSSKCNSFVKSASYLMHYETFDQIREIVLTKSNYFVEDDTGIPYKYISKDNFNIELFGVYEKPVKDFSENLFQSDLAAAYSDSTIYKGNISFSLGYHWGSRNQNQLIAIKKKTN